jgi:hypothetical protein
MNFYEMSGKEQKSRYTRAINALESLDNCPSGSFTRCLGKVINKPTMWRNDFEIDKRRLNLEEAARYLAFEELPSIRHEN